MIRRAFVRALSGAVFSALLGVKVETWKLEEPEEPEPREMFSTMEIGGGDVWTMRGVSYRADGSKVYSEEVRFRWGPDGKAVVID